MAMFNFLKADFYVFCKNNFGRKSSSQILKVN